MAAALGAALAPAGARAQDAPLDGPIGSCIDFVNSSTVLDDQASGSGSQGLAAGFHFIERTTAWDASRNHVECRLIGLEHMRPVIIFDWPTGATLVATSIKNSPDMTRADAEGDMILGCGLVDIMAQPFHGELRLNPYRGTAEGPWPVEVIIARSGSLCGGSAP